MANKLISELTNLATVANADEMEVQASGATVTKKATVEAVTKVERDARIAQDNVIEASVGLDADGSYPGFSGSNYLDSSTDVVDALDLLDTAIGSSNIVVEVISINNASMIAAGGSPVEIVAAPGATQWIDVISACMFLDYNAPIFAWAAGSPKGVLEYDTGSNHFIEWSNSFMVNNADIINKATWTSEVEQLLNKAVQFTYDTGANPTAGGSTAKIYIAYIIRNTSAS